MDKKDTYKYQLKIGRRIIQRNVTSDLVRREIEHQIRYPESKVIQIGRKTTRKAALLWLRLGGKRRYQYTTITRKGKAKFEGCIPEIEIEVK